MANEYATFQEFIDYVYRYGEAVEETEQNAANIERLLTVVSRALDFYLKTSFYGRNETRYYETDDGNRLYIDDLISVTTLETDDNLDGTHETLWTSTDYVLHPVNARAAYDALAPESEALCKPYRRIEVDLNGDNSFPVNEQRAIKIVRVFGYCDGMDDEGDPEYVPEAIKEATLMIVYRLWKRPSAPFGISGNAAITVQNIARSIQTDKDIQFLLSSVSERATYYLQ